MNFTIEVPEGTTHHGDPKLLRKPPNWQDYIPFYALNYLIHAATIPSEPGESKREVIFAVLNALFIPGFGVLRAVRRLMLRPGLRRRVPLECAGAAWRPLYGRERTIASPPRVRQPMDRSYV